MNSLHKKHILFVQHAGIGGAFISLRQIVTEFIGSGAQVSILLLKNDLIVIDELKKLGAQVIVEKKLSQFRFVAGGWTNIFKPLHLYFIINSIYRYSASLQKFRELIDKINPDVVYLNSLCIFHYAKIAKEAGFKVVLHIREMYKPARIFKIINSWHKNIIQQYTDVIFSIGKEEVNRLGLNKKTFIIQNYIDLKCWQSPVNKEKNSTFTILYAGGFNIIKGYHILIRALSILKKKGVSFKCIFIGVTEKKDRIFRKIVCRLKKNSDCNNDIIQKYDLSDRITLLSFVLNPVELFYKSDLLVFPSIEPHFPRPIIEAGAVCIPVIASDLPGPRDVVITGKNGILIDAGNHEVLAEKILFLMENPEIASEMGKSGRAMVEEKFNSSVNGSFIHSKVADITNGN